MMHGMLINTHHCWHTGCQNRTSYREQLTTVTAWPHGRHVSDCSANGLLQETYVKLQHDLSLAEEKLRKAHSQGKLLESDRKMLDVGIAKANNSIKVCRPSMHAYATHCMMPCSYSWMHAAC